MNQYIPVLVIPCDSLNKQIKKYMKYSAKMISKLSQHIMHCDNCDVTNNNNIDPRILLNNIDSNNILYSHHFKKSLNAYLHARRYAKYPNDAYFMIRRILKNNAYKSTFILEFTT